MKTFPILYKKTSTGALQEWTVSAEGNYYWTVFGQVAGKHTESEKTCCVGKQGRTDAEQALFEAEALWTKKLKAGGYVQTKEAATYGASSTMVEGGEWPMLAKRFDKDGDKIRYPAFCQRKYDGHRCIAVVKDGKCTLWSRTRKPINSVPHIAHAFELLGVDIVADGELYNPDYHDKFDELSHFIRQSKPIPGHEIVQYHCYDVIMPGGFSTRLAFRDTLKFKHPIVAVETIEVEDEDDVILAFERFRAEKYEGAMIRNTTGEYVSHPSHRSSDLQKVKEMDDAEFEIVGVKEGKGKMAGHAIFIVQVSPGITADAKMKGKLDNLRQYWEHPELAIGRQLTVQYQGYTKDGSLRFPVALRFFEHL